MMVQGAHSPSARRFAELSEAHMHPDPGSNAPTGALPQAIAAPPAVAASDTTAQPPSRPGKRKAETQENERLSKRLSLLNLEQSGHKLYVPVETPRPQNATAQHVAQPSESMELDDSKHKVYIYNLDDELSSESEDEEGKLVFLPDIEKHLRETRIPQQVLANKDGELAGMQLVLYKEPASLLVPQDKDALRKAAIEASQRAREKQTMEQAARMSASVDADRRVDDDEAMDMD